MKRAGQKGLFFFVANLLYNFVQFSSSIYVVFLLNYCYTFARIKMEFIGNLSIPIEWFTV